MPTRELAIASIDDRWWEPADLLARVSAIHQSTSPREFVVENSHKRVREMQIAADFASRRPWNMSWEIRPVPEPDQFPDFELRSGNDIRQFEQVEADREGRRRGTEYPNHPSQECQWEHYDPDEEAAAAPKEILRAITRKAAKNYRPVPHLLVHVNLTLGDPSLVYGLPQASELLTKFESVWLYWQTEVYRISPDPARIVA